ncbi:hypothetical protein ACHAXR_003659 [Thalassiosira sp. AJA248-18]
MTNSGEGLRVRNIERVRDDFHSSFVASCRSYSYLIDLENDNRGDDSDRESSRPRISSRLVPKLNQMLRALESKELDYFAFFSWQGQNSDNVVHFIPPKSWNSRLGW